MFFISLYAKKRGKSDSYLVCFCSINVFNENNSLNEILKFEQLHFELPNNVHSYECKNISIIIIEKVARKCLACYFFLISIMACRWKFPSEIILCSEMYKKSIIISGILIQCLNIFLLFYIWGIRCWWQSFDTFCLFYLLLLKASIDWEIVQTRIILEDCVICISDNEPQWHF